jgi:hypothetical protein
MIPSGYKEDVVYSQIPTSGAGDLSFTRASNGTRINSAGLVEVCPWNLITYSEEFNNGGKTLVYATIGADVTTAPNGTTTADSLIEDNSNNLHAVYNFGALTYVAGIYSLSCYVKKGTRDWVRVQLYDGTNNPSVYANVNTGVLGTIGGGATATIESIGNGWYRISISATMLSATGGWAIYSATSDGGTTYTGTNGATALYLWGLQINIGATAKPYFPTTDRLNVPRLTYQNGGGGCPSLLLEKQSTNLVTYSEQIDNADWTKQSGVSVTANQTISPDGTQNADLVVGNGSAGVFQNGKTVPTSSANTKSVWLKGVSGGEVVRLQDPDQTIGFTVCTLTTSWQRFTLSETQSGGSAGLFVRLIPSGGIYIWGAQVEASSYPTSYIPTTSSSATRVADLSTSDTIQTAQTFAGDFTIFADFVPFIDSTDANGMMVLGGGASSLGATYKSYLWFVGSNVMFTGDAETTIIQRGYSMVVNQRVKIALTRVGSTVKMFINGAQVQTTATSSTSITIRSIGWSYNLPTYQTQGKINQILLSATGASDADAISLTTI